MIDNVGDVFSVFLFI